MNENIVAQALNIKGCWEKDGYTYYSVSGHANGILKLDHVYSKWMRALYLLVAHIAEERKKRSVDLSKIETTPKYQFFGLAESVADQFMYFLMKDQMSESRDNQELEILCYDLLFAENNDTFSIEPCFAELKYVELKSYMAKLVVAEFNSFLSGQFYDFYVSYWSCFEACINQICEPYEMEIQKKLNRSRCRKMKKFLNDLYEDWPNREEIISRFEKGEETFNEGFGQYTSFPDKYTYLIKNVIGSHYTRDQKADRRILEFCGAQRNTVHNNGVHLKADMQIEIEGRVFRLKKAEKSYTEDFSQIFVLAREIFDIYIAIIDGLDTV